MSECQRCQRGQGCGAGALSGLSNTPAVQIQCATHLDLAAGQNVTVEFDERGSSWLWLVFGAYGLPLLGMLLATVLAALYLEATGHSGAIPVSAELLSILAAAIGLTGGFIAWRVVAPRVLETVQRSLCLQSTRIVAISPTSEREP